MTVKKIKEETQPVPRQIRGVLKALGEDKYMFTPQGHGESTQANVVSVGNAKMYDTVGRKPQRMVSLKVSSDAPDIHRALQQQLDELMKDCKTEAEQPPKATEEVVCLYKAEHVRLYVDEPQKLIRMYHEIPMVQGVNYAQELMDTMIKCNQVLTVNRAMIQPLERRSAEGCYRKATGRRTKFGNRDARMVNVILNCSNCSTVAL